MSATGGDFVVAPALVPGWHAVLFSTIGGATERVTVLNLETGEHKTLIDGGGNPTYVDTGHIVFVRDTTLMACRSTRPSSP